MELKLGDGMYEKVTRHDEQLLLHGERLSMLEDSDRRHEDRLKQLEDQSIKLENTVMTESRDTRKTMTELTDKMLDLLGNSISSRSVSEINEHKLKMAKWNTVSTVFLKVTGGLFALLSTGSIGYAIIMYFLGGE